ncbi:MAG: winged helix-turn-helix domain-containing protein [Tissierellales bacterium]|nr:winged helix-turn-helix domain-containing protein [Tissierellales bacterium]
MQEIKRKLTNFKLSGVLKSLESRNQYAIEKGLSYLEFLELLLEDEVVNRQSNSFKKRFAKSKLDSMKTISGYDFSYQPELKKQEVLDVASCRFIGEKKNLIFMGNPGVGKTHLANAIGIEALKKGYKEDREVHLTKTEFEILRLLAENKGKVFSIEKIYNRVWQDEFFVTDNTVTVHIRKLREKLGDDDKNPKYIKTIWGVGYKVEKN